MSDDAIKRAEALLTLIRECVRFADWAAGQGIAPADGEPASAPEDVIMAFLDHVEVDWAAGFTDSVMAQLAVTAADLAGLAEGTHVVVPVADLERVALIAEYDYPGDAPEFCGMLCQLCGGLDGHETECALAARPDAKEE